MAKDTLPPPAAEPEKKTPGDVYEEYRSAARKVKEAWTKVVELEAAAAQASAVAQAAKQLHGQRLAEKAKALAAIEAAHS